MKQLKRIKGTQDILPEESPEWIAIENVIREVMQTYNYKELRTPIFEQTELFARGIGQLTDIVSKEMYTFLDRGKKQLTLKPEMTAPIIRAFLENKLYAINPLNKFYYIAPLFRQENPQAGRLRQFHQFGAEMLGSAEPFADVEMIDLVWTVYDRMGIKNLKLKINSVGDPTCRDPYRKKLQDYLRPLLSEYCEDCQRRFEENPMRILDCKNESCAAMNQKAPKLSEHLCNDCSDHFEKLKSGLTAIGIGFELDPFLVRGLDYYTRTVFEISSDDLGAQNAICGGGRYDLLSVELGGIPAPAVGFASGIERILMVLEKQKIRLSPDDRIDIFLVTLGAEAQQEGLKWLKKFRSGGWKTEQDYLGRSLKAQMREANRQKARFVMILGENELREQVFSVKLMDKGDQINVPFDDIIPFLKKRQDHA
ncbi:MAG: histidine--tRNA ligase [Calditrichaceae bacterium]